jgi:hypothetical protein
VGSREMGGYPTNWGSLVIGGNTVRRVKVVPMGPGLFLGEGCWTRKRLAPPHSAFCRGDVIVMSPHQMPNKQELILDFQPPLFYFDNEKWTNKLVFQCLILLKVSDLSTMPNLLYIYFHLTLIFLCYLL